MAGEKIVVMGFINVNKAFAEKSPSLYKKIPACVIRFVEKLIHQDEMNGFMDAHIHDSSIDFATAGLDFFQVGLHVHGEENIPAAGRKIVVSNHPLGGLDGLALISVLGRYRSDIKFPVNDLLMQLTPMKEVFIPINKHGRNNINATQQLNEAFASNDLILYFPAGLCSRKINGEICDLEWKKSIITKAKEFKRDIVPAFFDGKNSNRFYNLANIRKKLKIKANLEMALLPDEAFRQKGNTINVTFGKEIPYSHFDKTKNDKEWVQWLKKKVYALKKNT
ncbi:1-acyl-sn-glycerol-3-phosphate acyltransferase [Bacteroidales bacterium OttesenSCG-928-E04]|nr:1-acyl-sn-glycerol-3-phosphate acyltransferase [Bacteroidales bacterium OttesenSCG-928-E04]MDL2326489.1 1-acyl-sn-glycerol-3-phosphate acyltransferase [Bacteroidales bacterium OttesenSCG-928-A14]